MKSSRAMLLAAMLFVAPAFADDQVGQVQGTNTEAQDAPKAEDKKEVAQDAPKAEDKKEVAQDAPKAEDKKEAAQDAPKAPEAPKAEDKKEEAKTEQPSWFAAKWLVLTGFGTTVANYTVTPVAEWTTIPALKQLLRISYLKGGKFETNLPVIGKSMVVVAAAGAALAAYNAMNQQDEDADETMFE